MSDRMDNKELVKRVAQRTGRDETVITEVIDAALEEMVAAFKQGASLSLRKFGTFYVRPERSSTVQRIKPLTWGRK